MNKSILIVEDEFVVADDLQLTLEREGYSVIGIATSVREAREMVKRKKPGLVLLDIYLRGPVSGIEYANELRESGIAFVYLSANSSKQILEAAKATEPYGFLVKPYRERDLIVTLDIAFYRHEHSKDVRSHVEVHTNISKKEIKNNTPLEGIVGSSPSLLTMLDLASIVAPQDTSVLILGESGTGKEKFADYIHQKSPRHHQSFIKINCTTLPPTLIESELFGHEKGAFTGAMEKKIGKFELADKGTIFLDEIGEMPLSLQVKLLRVLQEKEIERIGGKQTIKVDVRIIAATNRILECEIAEGRFRLDLYYRLNVFPITLPPLRERREDILPLAMSFAEKFSKKFNKPFEGISDHMIAELQNYDWPGNIRELENVIEQSMILHDAGARLNFGKPFSQSILLKNLKDQNVTQSAGLAENKMSTNVPVNESTLEENERNYILQILKKTNGRIRGAGGAAEILKIPPTTLHSKMKKLGITRTHQ